jgi:hypothetical protein
MIDMLLVVVGFKILCILYITQPYCSVPEVWQVSIMDMHDCIAPVFDENEHLINQKL